MKRLIIRILRKVVRFIYGPGPSELMKDAGEDMIKTINEEFDKTFPSRLKQKK